MPNARYVFIWENFGPQHHDRLNAVAEYFGSSAQLIGIELSQKSGAYVWQHQINSHIDHYVVCRDEPHFFLRSLFSQISRLVPLAVRQRRAVYCVSHYEQPVIFILACILRVLGQRVIVMNDSKFDDYDRSIAREILKFCLYLPYRGALVASHRSAAYLSFLGVPRQNIRLNYDNLSRDRVRSLAPTDANTNVPSFSERYFIVVARLIEKKNLFRTLDAYAQYRQFVSLPRRLVIVGYGPLEQRLKDHAKALGLTDHVEFAGALAAEGVAKRLNASLALLLLSTEEQFGQVVLEAQALAVPVIVSHSIGAVDCFVRNNVNGLIVDPYDIDNIVRAMIDISEIEAFWMRLSKSAEPFSKQRDAKQFAISLDDLTRNLK